jgi:hypothetical protein
MQRLESEDYLPGRSWGTQVMLSSASAPRPNKPLPIPCVTKRAIRFVEATPFSSGVTSPPLRQGCCHPKPRPGRRDEAEDRGIIAVEWFARHRDREATARVGVYAIWCTLFRARSGQIRPG